MHVKLLHYGCWRVGHELQVPQAASRTSRTVLPTSAQWSVNNVDEVKSFSAIGFLTFAGLAEQLGVPVGIVESAYGTSVPLSPCRTSYILIMQMLFVEKFCPCRICQAKRMLIPVKFTFVVPKAGI